MNYVVVYMQYFMYDYVVYLPSVEQIISRSQSIC